MSDVELRPVREEMQRVVRFKLGSQVPQRGNRLSRALAIGSLSLFGWRVEGGIPDLPKMLLVAAPHTSNWDMVVGLLAVFALGLHLSFMAKHTLFRGPARFVMQVLGGVPVDRRAPHGMVGEMIQAYGQREQLVLAVLPEGTRSYVTRWRTGFYHIAVGAGVPLVATKFDYGRKVMEFGPTFYPTGDLEADLPKIQALFKDVVGKRPENAFKVSG
ncbi:MAG: lysophospholipid acyltransferase family protein [Anaerolineales bacterium]|nr:lysophospholipid acyltransferase family protein [Anaerolineales bacterium]